MLASRPKRNGNRLLGLGVASKLYVFGVISRRTCGVHYQKGAALMFSRPVELSTGAAGSAVQRDSRRRRCGG